MTSSAAESFKYCDDLVRRRDEDRWLAARYAPPGARNRLLAFYALHFDIERIPSLVSEAMLGEMRLQWWRDAIAEVAEGASPRAHPAVQAAHASDILGADNQGAYETSIDAHTRLLYKEPFQGCDDLTGFLQRADGFLARLAAQMLAPGISQEIGSAIDDVALASALARRGRALAPELEIEVCERAEKLHGEAIQSLRALPPEAMPAVAHFALTPRYLRNRSGPAPLTKRLRVFAAIATGRV